VWHLPLTITEIPTCTTLNKWWALDFRAWVKIAESCPKTLHNLWYVICTIYGLEKGPLAPMSVHVTSKNDPYILHMLHKNFTFWKQLKFFILSGNLLLRESPFHVVNCLKLFDFTLISTPALDYIQKKELASFYNTTELIKVLCNVIKIFFDHSVMLHIT